MIATRSVGEAVTFGFLALYAGGFAVNGFFRLADWRTVLIGAHAASPGGALALLAAVSALAWVTLARKRAVWMSPAELTWRDATDRRVRVLRRRLLTAWGWRAIAIAYIWAMAAALTAASTPIWVLGSTAGVAVAALVLLALNPARTARRAGRSELVARWRQRNVRAAATQFLDPMLLLDAACPLAISLAGASLARYLTHQVAGRWHTLLLAVLLLAVALALTHVAPALPAPAMLATFGYASLLPTASGLGRLCQHAGLRRWTATGDIELRATSAAVLIVPALTWCALAIAGGAPPVTLALAPVIAAALIRTVTRPAPRYAVPRPVFLILHTARGADLLVAATAILLIGLTPWLAALLISALTIGGVLS